MNAKKALGLIVVVAAVGSACGVVNSVRRGDPDLRLPGRVEIQGVRLSSKIGGRVKRLHVDEGQLVEAGVPVVEFDASELEARRDQLSAQIRGVEAQLEK